MKIDKKASLGNLVFSGIIPLVFLLFLVGFIFGPGASILDLGILLPDVSIERIDFFSSEIQVTVRNTGPMAVEIAMADVNDRIQPAAIEPDRHLERFETALVRIPFEWNEGEPYTVGITVNDGTRFEKGIEAATEALKPSLELVGFFTLIGTYVGIIPVMIGLFWLPFIKKISKKKYFLFSLDCRAFVVFSL